MMGISAGAQQRLAWAIAVLLLVRGAMAVFLPLSADEAYYWLWSRHLDFGYFDHPPAIAWIIKPGTLLLGDSVIGIRLCGIVLSLATSWLLFQSALLILKDRGRALTAVLLFNLTLMINAEMLAATPDLPSVACSVLFLFCLAKLRETEKGAWWLAVGAAGGLGMLSKYAAGFLGLGAVLWLIADPKARAWLLTPWPWMGGVLALLVFLPNLLWQASHQWETFAFQFGRIAGHGLTTRYLIEFLGAQLGLASPLIFVLGVAGFLRARPGQALALPAALIAPAIVYFIAHSLHDRVQGNWPAFLYPMLAILAAAAMGETGWRGWATRLAAALAALMLLIVYVQALTGVLPLKNDPVARLLGASFRPVADGLPKLAEAQGAAAILTTDYETTAWLRFYEPGLKVIQVGETYRYPHAPSPPPDLLDRPLLYVAEEKRDRRAWLGAAGMQPLPVPAGSGYRIWRREPGTGLNPSRMP